MTTSDDWVAFDTNIYIFGMREEPKFPACAEPLKKIDAFHLHKPRQIVRERQKNLQPNEVHELFGLLKRYTDRVKINWHLTAFALIEKFQGLGCKLGDAKEYRMNPINNLGVGEVVLRLVAAAAVGCAIGLNRELKGKPAGLRTHALVTLGAALFTLSSIHFSLSLGVAGADALSRVMQGIITGLGFLGAGVILRDEGGHVRGLTTAATIWVAASLGILCGIGYWIGVIIAVSLVLIVLVVGEPVERFFERALGKMGRKPKAD